LVNVDAWLLLSNQAAHIAVGPVATTPGGADFLLAALVELARRSEGPSAMAALQAAVNASVASVVGGARSPSGPKSDPLLWAEVGSPEHELCRDESQQPFEPSFGMGDSRLGEIDHEGMLYEPRSTLLSLRITVKAKPSRRCPRRCPDENSASHENEKYGLSI
jgi:hypothetical protein